MCKKRLFVVSVILIFSIAIPVIAKQSTKQFLTITRNNHPEKTWAILIGTVSNRRRGISSINSANLKVGMRFTNSRVLTKITIKEELEGIIESYMVGQPYNGQPASILSSDKNMFLLGEFGLRPEDLTMTFLYWDIKKEFKNESVKGFACRVIGLINPKTKEFVKVYISTKYYKPIKVEWFKANQTDAYRNVIVTSFETKGSLGAPSKFILYGPGWRTKIDFDKIKLGYTKDGIPKNIFTDDFPE